MALRSYCCFGGSRARPIRKESDLLLADASVNLVHVVSSVNKTTDGPSGTVRGIRQASARSDTAQAFAACSLARMNEENIEEPIA